MIWDFSVKSDCKTSDSNDEIAKLRIFNLPVYTIQYGVRMNKTLLVFITSLMSAGVFSKNIESGTVSVSGGLGMQLQSQTQSTNGSSIDYSIFTNQVDAAYFFKDNIAIGLRGANQSTTIKSTAGQAKSATNFLVPNITYNQSFSETIALRLSIGYVLGNGNSESDNVVVGTFDQSGFEVKASLPIFDRDYLSVDPFFIYRSSSVSYNNGNEFDITDTVFGFTMSVYYNLLGK